MAWFIDIIAPILVLAPLLGAALAMPLGIWVHARSAELFCVSMVSLSALLSIFLLFAVALSNHQSVVSLLTWVNVAGFSADWAVRIDMLSVVMFFIVTTISALVHVYALGYMHSDPSRPRFFAYLNLFTFMMLALVSANGFLQLFFGWEGVGLASYLLIGFWHQRPSANAASLKAFIVNRVGDAFFLLGLALIYMLKGSLDFDVLFDNVDQLAQTTIALPLGLSISAANLIGGLLLLGAMGKSAQILFHVWLPDAMEGPTPVSALIHAATMVTAGIFVIARISPVYEQAPEALWMVGLVGGVTALFAATIGLVQNDIKRVIAYSTCSQLGYMFAALGLGAYSAAIFHLFTHAFFKALLFLGAGSVLHAIDHEQDITHMNGLSAKKMPLTWGTMLVGVLSLTGFPLSAGFFSKDVIIEAAFASPSWIAIFLFWLLLISAALTAFYAWRLFFLTFHMEEDARSSHGVTTARESPPVMTVPLVLLAFASAIIGMVAYPSFVGDAQADFWQGALPAQGGGDILNQLHNVPIYIIFAPIIASLIGFSLAWFFYMTAPAFPVFLMRRFAWVYRLFYNKWYFDEIYHWLFTLPSLALGRFFWKIGDLKIIDGLGPNGISARVLNFANIARSFQTGYLYHYAFIMLFGLSVMVSWVFWQKGDFAYAQTLLLWWEVIVSALPAWADVMNLPDLPALPELPNLPALPEFPDLSDLFDWDMPDWDFPDWDLPDWDLPDLGDLLDALDFSQTEERL